MKWYLAGLAALAASGVAVAGTANTPTIKYGGLMPVVTGTAQLDAGDKAELVSTILRIGPDDLFVRKTFTALTAQSVSFSQACVFTTGTHQWFVRVNGVAGPKLVVKCR